MSKNRNLVVIGAIIIVAAVIGATYWYTFLQKPKAPEILEVKLGVVLPLSGRLGHRGDGVKKGQMLAIEEINEHGIESLGGAKIKLVYGDSCSDPIIGATEAERLITVENVLAIIGLWHSANAMPVTDICEKYHVPAHCSGVSDMIMQRGFKYTFRTNVNASCYGEGAVNFLVDVGKKTGAETKTVVLLYEDTAHGASANAASKRVLERYPEIKVVLEEPYPPEMIDAAPLVDKAIAAEADAWITSWYTSDAILIINELAARNYWPPHGMVVAAGSLNDPVFIDAVGDRADYAVSITSWTLDIKTPWAPGLVEEVNNKYMEKYDAELNYDAAGGFGDTYVIYDALERAGSELLDALAENDIENARVILRNSIAETDLKSLDQPGGRGLINACGRVKFNEAGQNIHATGIAFQLRSGKWPIVWPWTVASEEVVWPYPK